MIGTLVGVLHKTPPPDGAVKLDLQAGVLPDGSHVVAVRDLDVREIIRRWVRGFHAALYREFLPATADFMTNTPLPEGEQTSRGVEFQPVPEAIPEFVKEIKKNRATGTLDRVATRNGKCTYECVWSQADRGQWLCIYALDVHNRTHDRRQLRSTRAESICGSGRSSLLLAQASSPVGAYCNQGVRLVARRRHLVRRGSDGAACRLATNAPQSRGGG